MSDGKRLYGVQYDPAKDRSYPFWEQEFDYSDLTTPDDPERKSGEEARTQYDQSVTGRDAAKGRQYDVTAIRASILLEMYVKPVKLRVTSLPPTLNGVSIDFNKSGGAGVGNHPSANITSEVTTAGTGGFSPKSSAQSSASILPVVSWNIDNWQADALVNAKMYEFSVASPYTIADVLTRLNASPLSLSVTDLPIFKKKQITLKLFGGQVSIQQSADSSASLSFNLISSPTTQAWSREYGDTYSTEVGVSVHTETSPYCIFGTITLSAATSTQTCTTTVKANTPVLVELGSTIVTAITNEPTPITATANASVAAGSSLSATSPASIPVTGLYLVDVQASDDEFGLIRIQAFVVDFSQYA